MGGHCADGCSPQTEPVLGVDHRYYCLLAIEKVGDWEKLEILIQNREIFAQTFPKPFWKPCWHCRAGRDSLRTGISVANGLS